MNFKKMISIFCLMVLLVLSIGCHSQKEEVETKDEVIEKDHIVYDDNDYYSDYEDEEYTEIDLDNEDSDIIISNAGIYVLKGTLNNNSIIIDANNDVIRLVLKNVEIYCEDSAPIYAKNCEKLIISLPEGTQNTIQDGDVYTVDNEEEPSATIFSKDDLTFNGTGSLTILANYKNAIQSKDVLKMMEGDYDINTVNDGIKGKDSLFIRDGNYQITCLGDGLITTNENEDGQLVIEKGVFMINTSQDGIQSAATLDVYDGDFTITSGNGSTNHVTYNQSPFGEFDDYEETNSPSMKGIKAKKDITFYSGTYSISSTDDAIHGGTSILINDGTFQLASDDDGIHCDGELIIETGKIDISYSYEGLEANNITINGSEISIVANDDGINAASDTNTSCVLTIHGGNIYVDAYGDGIDSNGDIVMDGGTLIVMGPENDGNAALDYDGTFNIDGGVMITTGTAGMAMTPSSSSSQSIISVNLSSQENGTAFYLTDNNDVVIAAITPIRSYNNIIVSTPNLSLNSTYKMYIGGTLENVINNYSTSASGGNLIDSITINSTITTYGNAINVFNQGGRP